MYVVINSIILTFYDNIIDVFVSKENNGRRKKVDLGT